MRACGFSQIMPTGLALWAAARRAASDSTRPQVSADAALDARSRPRVSLSSSCTQYLIKCYFSECFRIRVA